jgi:Domain of unknown function (DUF4326)
MPEPQRIQLSRKSGYRKPEGAAVVSRPGKWGNPYSGIRAEAVELFTVMLAMNRTGSPMVAYPSDAEIRAELGGRDLACWCPAPAEGEPDVCHGSVLLSLANPALALPGPEGEQPRA